MIKSWFIYLFWLVFLLNSNVYAQQNKWQLNKDEEGFKVYTREVENSKIKEFKATGLIKASQKTVLNILQDPQNYPKWIVDISYAEKVDQSQNEISIYYQLNLPWPIKDRDVAMIMEVHIKSDNSVVLDIISGSNIKAVSEDFIRMDEVKGFWKLDATTKDTCEVTYQFLADPKGDLPSWVINLFLVDGPFQTLKNLNQYAVSKEP